MKTLLFLIISLFVSSNVFAVTELLEATDLGRTHIDPISMTTFINYRTNYEYATPKVTYAKCKLDAEGKPIKNYFILKFEDEKGVIQNRYMVKSGSSCEEIRATEKAITSCEEHSALEFSVSDPDECKEGKCKELGEPRVASTPLSINLGGNDPNPSQNIKNLQDEIAKCSPDKKFILVRDGTKSLVASLSDMSHCKLDKKRVITDGAKWDDGASPLTQIFTSNRSGFYIGDHTHYYFDESQKQWCIHFRPDLGSTAPSCGYNNMTRSIAFALPGETNISQKGAVKLSVDANGNPSAIIGHSKSDTYSKTPELDESKSLLQISLSNKAGEGRKTVFESKPNLAGATTNTLTVSPSFSVGSKLAQPKSCDSNACLNAPKEVLDPNSPLQCSKNENTTFAMPGSGKDTCYSCNGVSSGACGKEKVLLNKGNLLDYTQKINACRSSDSKTTEPIDATEDIIK